MTYPMLDDDERDDQHEENDLQSRDIKEVYRESTGIDEDEKDFLNVTFRLSKFEREVVVLSGEFNDQEITAYEAKIKLMALLDLVSEMRDELSRTL